MAGMISGRLAVVATGFLMLAGCGGSPSGVMVSPDATSFGGGLYAETLKHGSEVLILDGPIRAGTSYAFQMLVELSEINGLVIAQSSGGDLAAAHQIGEVIRRKKINTAVLAACYSACVDVFVAGKERLIARDAELMVHTASDPVQGYAIDKPYWTRLGLGAFNDRVYSMKPNEVWVIPADRAIQLRLATGYFD